jgi:hypothetical protein
MNAPGNATTSANATQHAASTAEAPRRSIRLESAAQAIASIATDAIATGLVAGDLPQLVIDELGKPLRINPRSTSGTDREHFMMRNTVRGDPSANVQRHVAIGKECADDMDGGQEQCKLSDQGQ